MAYNGARGVETVGCNLTKSQDEDLLDELRRVAGRTLRAAGPRYAPSLDPQAPNLAIAPLQRAADALAQGSAFCERVKALSGEIRKAYERDDDFANALFKRRVGSFQRITADLDAIASANTVVSRRAGARGLRRHLRSVRSRLSAAEDELMVRLRALEGSQPGTASEKEKKARSSERDLLQARLGAIRRLEEALYKVVEFADGDEGDLVAGGSSILLLGDWGTGKTHFLCDYAVQAIDDGTPTLVVLANTLRSDVPPLDAIAETTGLAPNGAALRQLLDAKAKVAGRRALIMIDAINESDRETWRRALPGLDRDAAGRGTSGLSSPVALPSIPV